MSKTRIEKDSMGEVQVPATALYGAQTQRAINNFSIGNQPMPAAFIHALALVKKVCALSNLQLGLLEQSKAEAIATAATAVAEGQHDDQFPVDVFQTGSGTSSNMNMNEVIATIASPLAGEKIHPNDHVNMGQSSNDVIPTAIHVSASLLIDGRLLPALSHLEETIKNRSKGLLNQCKTGRTHLMDAMPITCAQELDGWAQQVHNGYTRINASLPGLLELAQGGTAVGTGINCDPRFAELFCQRLSDLSGLPFRAKPNYFEALSSQDSAVEMSGQLRTVAVSLNKIANDLRWMNSGPVAGLGDIRLAALQPGSSIMPGKVNPVIPEAVAMAVAHVVGHDACIAWAGATGNFQLNTMLPVIAANLLNSVSLLANAATALADKAIKDFVVNEETLNANLTRNPILVTALNRVIGYERGAKIAKRAYAENRSLIDVAKEETDFDEATLKRMLDPMQLTRGGVVD